MSNGGVNREVTLSVSAIVVLSLTALSWFSESAYAVAGYDFATSINPGDDMMRSLYLWDERLYAGAPNLLSIGSFPYFFLQRALEWISGSLYHGHMVFFLLLLMLPGLSMYLLMRTIFAGVEHRNDMSILAAVFYMLNTFVVIKWNRGELVTLLSYGMVPLYLALFERLTRERLNIWVLAAFITVMFFYPVTMGHSADFIIVTMLFAAFVLWRVVAGPHRLKKLKNAVMVGVCVAATGAWWIYPLFTGVAGGSGAVTSFSTADNIGLVNYYSSWATLLNMMKMWFFAMYPTNIEFNTQFYRPGTLLFPILGFYALAGSRNRYVLFFSLIAIFGLWLSKGTHAPYAWIYEWLYMNVPYFFIFRAPTRNFPIVYVLCLAVLLGFSVTMISAKIRSWWPGSRVMHRLPAAAVILLIFFHAWPIFSRSTLFMTDKDNVLYPSIFLDVPGYYFDANGWLSERDGYFRVHSFSNRTYMNYTWGYSSTDITPKLIEFPQTVKHTQELVFGNLGIHSLLDELDRSFWDWDFQGTEKILGLLGARYILVADDVMRRYMPDTNYPEVARAVLDTLPGIRKVKSFGAMDIYENSFAVEHFIAAPSIKKVVGGFESLRTLAAAGYLDHGPFMLSDGFSVTQASSAGDAVSAGAINEVVFANMNMIDEVCEYIAPEYRFAPRPGASEFHAKGGGKHLVWARDPVDGETIPGLDRTGRYASPGAETGVRWSYLGVWDSARTGEYISVDERTKGRFAVVPVDLWYETLGRAELEAASSGVPLTHLFRLRKEGPELETNRPRSFFARGAGGLRGTWGEPAPPLLLSITADPVPAYSPGRVYGYREYYAGGDPPGKWIFQNTSSGVVDGGVRLAITPFDGFIRAGRAIAPYPVEDGSSGVDLEEFPYLSIEGESAPEGSLDLDAEIWVDHTGDGWADGFIRTPVMRDGSPTRPENMTELLRDKYGQPGKAEYRGVRLIIKATRPESTEVPRSRPVSMKITGFGFYHDVPQPEPVRLGSRLVASVDGERLGVMTHERVLGARPGAGYHALTAGPAHASTGRYDYVVKLTDGAQGPKGIASSSGTPAAPKLRYTKIDPTKYVVDVEATDGERLSSFWLVFNEAFHPDWTATVQRRGSITRAGVINGPAAITAPNSENTGKASSMPRITDASHRVINGYANGWWVDARDDASGTGFSIIVEFTPQRSLDTGILVSIYSATFLVFYVPFYAIVLRRFFV